ncbi:hypothetical protein ANN_19036 [Periplaneta americana]|uniref:Uncharacterized protein n=1 Tax=Periplaneta americana TaxID=6978 RepID=A0ABQ8SQD5_PERAM|nr:hypothetical protein ANN_19036 [Periplaneta americana]
MAGLCEGGNEPANVIDWEFVPNGREIDANNSQQLELVHEVLKESPIDPADILWGRMEEKEWLRDRLRVGHVVILILQDWRRTLTESGVRRIAWETTRHECLSDTGKADKTHARNSLPSGLGSDAATEQLKVRTCPFSLGFISPVQLRGEERRGEERRGEERRGEERRGEERRGEERRVGELTLVMNPYDYFPVCLNCVEVPVDVLDGVESLIRLYSFIKKLCGKFEQGWMITDFL